MIKKVNIVVIGAGFAGVSTAYHLARAGVKDVVILEKDQKPGLHASGNNAGMIRQSIGDPALAKMARQGRNALRKMSQNSWKKIHYVQNGSMLLTQNKDADQLKQIAKALKKEGVAFKRLSKEQAGKKVSILKDAFFDQALFCPTDSFVDIDALMDCFMKSLRSLRVKCVFNSPIRSIQKKGDQFLIKAGKQTFLAQKIINAAGGWAGFVSEKAKATKIFLKAYRRHLFFSQEIGGLFKKYPFVWDLSHDFYFRPVEDTLMTSPCDHTLVKTSRGTQKLPNAAEDKKVRDQLTKKINSFSKKFPTHQFKNVKRGLRTHSADGRFVIGEDPKLKDFYWVAGLGGHGLTTCFSIGRLTAGLIMKKKVDPFLKKAFSPRRFNS